MELLVLGAGPAYTNRFAARGAAYLLREGEPALVLDLGQGTFPALAAAIEPSGIEAIAISHLHPDHFVDLVPLRHYLRWEFEPARQVRVVAPAGLAARLDGLHAEPGFCAAALAIETLTAGSRSIGPFTIEAVRVTHTSDSHAFRVSVGHGPGLVYSGDCGRASDLDPLVRPGDVLLTEVSFGVGPVPSGALHLDAAAVAGLATRTKPARVLLTHLQMGYDRAATVAAVEAAADIPVRFVMPGDRVDLDGP